MNSPTDIETMKKKIFTLAIGVALILTGCSTEPSPQPSSSITPPSNTNESLTSAVVKNVYTTYLNDLNAISYTNDIVPIAEPLLADGTMTQEEQNILVKEFKEKFPTVFGRLYIPTNEENYESVIFSYYSSYIATLEAKEIQKEYTVPNDSIQMNGKVSVVNNESLKITDLKTTNEIKDFLSKETALVYVDNKWQIIPDYLVDSIDLASFNSINQK
jgi:hypothetical protein